MLEIHSEPTAITFFEDRAEVCRRATVQLQAGLHWVACPALSPFLDDSSALARASGAVVQTVRVKLRRLVPTGNERELLEIAQRQSLSALEQQQRAVQRAEAECRRAKTLWNEAWAALAQVPKQLAEATRLADFRQSLAAIEQALSHSADREQRERAALDQAERDHARASQRLGELAHQQLKFEGVIEILLDVQTDAEVVLELRYRTACALWRPEHRVRLRSGPTPGLEITSYACAWQCTGETWSNVTVAFSTARTARVAALPLLEEDLLQTREKQKKRVVVEAREQIIERPLNGVSSPDELPAVDDGGEVRILRAVHPTSLPSNARPVRVEVAQHEVPTELDVIAVPELSEVAHLRAHATWMAAAPLLAGPLMLMRDSTYVGRGRIRFVASGERFAIGLGPESALRVRREIHQQSDTGLLGGQRRKYNVRVYLSNVSGAPQTVDVQERVPVSEIEGLKVIVEAAGFRVDDDGFAYRKVQLAPHEHTQLELEYELRADTNVVLPV